MSVKSSVSVEYRPGFLISPVLFVQSWWNRNLDFAVRNVENVKNATESEHERYDVVDLSTGRFVKGDEL
jgi:hypothetical protein